MTERDVDVVVVGAGGGGLTAALAARERGASVAVLEKLDRPGGNTALSTGSIPGAGTRFQAAAGIEDSPNLFVADLLRQSGSHEAEDLALRLADISASLVEWLVDSHGIRLKLITDYRHVGHSVPRLHAPPSRKGVDLMADLLRACRDAEIEIAPGNPVKSLLTEGGAVCGVVIAGERVSEYTVSAGAVVLAANGYAADRALVERWAPDIAAATYFGAHGSTGEAIIWGEQLGARPANIGAYQGYAAVAYPHGALLSWTTVEKGGVLLDRYGRRFGDESIGYSGFTEFVLASEQPTYALFDTRICDDAAFHEEEFRELVESGGVCECATVGEVAEFIAASSAEVQATLDAYASAARGERPDEFGRRDFGPAPVVPPYVVCRVVPGLFHSQGGLAVDPDGRPRRHDGSVIPGLYAVGGVAAGISGRTGGQGYSSGSGLLSAIGLGRLAGSAAAADCRRP